MCHCVNLCHLQMAVNRFEAGCRGMIVMTGKGFNESTDFSVCRQTENLNADLNGRPLDYEVSIFCLYQGLCLDCT